MGGVMTKLSICQTPHLVCWSIQSNKHRVLNLAESVHEVLAEWGTHDYAVMIETYEDAPKTVKDIMKVKGYSLLHTTRSHAVFRHYHTARPSAFKNIANMKEWVAS